MKEFKEKLSDSYCTPNWLFDELDKEFGFDVDLCATKSNRKTKCWYNDYLNEKFCGADPETTMGDWNCAFMNPPYSNPKPFIEKAWDDSRFCKIVCLVKCDPSTKWWGIFWDYDIECPDCEEGVWFYNRFDTHNMGAIECERPCGSCNGSRIINRAKPGCEVRFFPKRIKFDPPEGFTGVVTHTYFPSALLIFDRRVL